MEDAEGSCFGSQNQAQLHLQFVDLGPGVSSFGFFRAFGSFGPTSRLHWQSNWAPQKAMDVPFVGPCEAMRECLLWISEHLFFSQGSKRAWGCRGEHWRRALLIRGLWDSL